ncbi:MAG: glycine cleavage system protein GcvH [Candidatus Marinimicrobia bacterium]|jgi:glycine cleavage system H protein|nr:glycine cleavage system protein GcvH [Candidatus Neomarinimicrobiota bacterium]MBT3501106.1 glycine cleavage system protein GcvH [Candidatus Neomarinimicrobiota bacterium]MBT3840502.1 glycine cleavage system protein GcvH [Candidatus Neomarinimicrobiota bacterium]MBT3999353.1 glycine cleavage system protein GcvH [Candidatus Neomarinimicrobiota bacterium]MBT4578438.1 glycine cleavage system protein GcvH [Candidatus Neomarinimicrobiota bacterium]
MNTPDNLLYTEDHEWAKYGNDNVTIGITDFAQSQLGDVIFVELPDVGEEFNAGDIFGEIEAVKTVSELFIPISGTISAVNEDLENLPDKVNSDPYNEGWLIKITPSDPDEKDELMNFLSYEEFVS